MPRSRRGHATDLKQASDAIDLEQLEFETAGVSAAAVEAAAEVVETVPSASTDVAGALERITFGLYERVVAADVLKYTECVTRVPFEPATGAWFVETAIDVMYSVLNALCAAEDGAVESTPKPNAATVTSAMRLKVVFVDICFLSISRSREFPSFGLKLKFLTSVR